MVKYTGLASGAGWTLLAIYAHHSGMTIGDRLLWGIPILAATLPQSVEWIHRMRSAIWYWRALRREDTDFWQRYTELEIQYRDMPQWKLINTSRDEEEWHQMITVDWQVVTTKPGTDGEIDVTGRRHIQTVEQRECMADFLPDEHEMSMREQETQEQSSQWTQSSPPTGEAEGCEPPAGSPSPQVGHRHEAEAELSEADLARCASVMTDIERQRRRNEEMIIAAQSELREVRDQYEPGSAQWRMLERMAETLPA